MEELLTIIFWFKDIVSLMKEIEMLFVFLEDVVMYNFYKCVIDYC